MFTVLHTTFQNNCSRTQNNKNHKRQKNKNSKDQKIFQFSLSHSLIVSSSHHSLPHCQQAVSSQQSAVSSQFTLCSPSTHSLTLTVSQFTVGQFVRSFVRSLSLCPRGRLTTDRRPPTVVAAPRGRPSPSVVVRSFLLQPQLFLITNCIKSVS